MIQNAAYLSKIGGHRFGLFLFDELAVNLSCKRSKNANCFTFCITNKQVKMNVPALCCGNDLLGGLTLSTGTSNTQRSFESISCSGKISFHYKHKTNNILIVSFVQLQTIIQYEHTYSLINYIKVQLTSCSCGTSSSGATKL